MQQRLPTRSNSVAAQSTSLVRIAAHSCHGKVSDDRLDTENVYGEAMYTKSVHVCRSFGVLFPLRTFNDTVLWQICHRTVYFLSLTRVRTRFRRQNCRPAVSLNGSDTAPVSLWLTRRIRRRSCARAYVGLLCQGMSDRITFSPMTWVKVVTMDLP